MEFRKFYANDMQEALRQIKEELGPDAVIISSKLVRQKTGLLGLFSKRVIEVVASYEPNKNRGFVPKSHSSRLNMMPNGEPRADTPSKASTEENQIPSVNATGFAPALKAYEDALTLTPRQPKDVDGDLGHQREGTSRRQSAAGQRDNVVPYQPRRVDNAVDARMDELRTMIDRLTKKLGDTDVHTKYTPEVSDLYYRLIERDVNAELAQYIAAKTDEIVRRKGAEPLEAMSSVMEEIIGTPTCLSPKKFQSRTVMLIGPTGVGKTTTLVKLASEMVVRHGLRIGIINADVYRVAASDHLRTYCDILGVEMLTIYHTEELADALAAFSDRDIVFIDTAGKVSYDEEYQKEIKDLVRIGQIKDIYLTLSASTADNVIKETIKNYAFLENHSIIVTKLDEVKYMGVLLYCAYRSGRPLAYLTNGQSVPDDITSVDVPQIIKGLLE